MTRRTILNGLSALGFTTRLAAEAPPPNYYRWEEFEKLETRVSKGRPYMESYELKGRRQLFIDNYIVEHMDHLKKVVHQPVRHSPVPLLKAEHPWEEGIYWLNVIRDDADQLFKVWYQTPNGVGYATSRDGLAWNKPILNLVPYKDSKANGLVLPSPGLDSPTILKDPLATDPARRYVIFTKHNLPKFGMYLGFSPDGIHWKMESERTLSSADDPTINDRPNFMIDVEKRRYVAMPKVERINPMGDGDWGMFHRMKTISFSTDLKRWTKPEVILKPDDQDPPTLQIYGMTAFNYEGAYIGLMDMFHSHDTGPDALTVDVQLAVSRDGENWWRAGNRQPFFSPGPEDAWDRYRVYQPNTPPIRVGDELWIYYRGSATRHGTLPPDYRFGSPWFARSEPDPPLPADTPLTGMGLAKMRVDGFVSLDAGNRPGRLLTRPLLFKGNQLHLNADARNGYIKAEVYLPEHRNHRYGAYNWSIGQPVAGFTLQDSKPFRGNQMDGVLNWNGGGLDRFAGQFVVLRFELVDASLYSFWVA